MNTQMSPPKDLLVFDIETDGLLPTMTKIHCITIVDTDDPTRVLRYGPEDVHLAVDFLMSTSKRICGHNIIAFDIPVIKKFYPGFTHKFLPLDTKIWSQLVTADIRDLTQRNPAWNTRCPAPLVGSHSLKAWGYRLGILKGETPDATWQTYSPEMLDYCAQDSLVTLALVQELERWTTSDSAVDLEMEVALILERQERQGINFDTRKAEVLAVQLMDELAVLKNELQGYFPSWQQLRKRAISKVNNAKLGRTKGVEYEVWDTIEFNPNSNQHVVRCLQEKYGWEPTVLTDKGNPQMDDEILADLELLGTMPEVATLRKYKTASKILSYLSAGEGSWLHYVTPEGKIHGNVQGCGAGTRRQTHNSPNLGQVPSHRAYLGKECRSLFSPPPGYVMVGIDADQLELRTMSHYLHPFDDGVYAHAAIHGTKENKDDIHWRNAQCIRVDRDLGKTIYYAWVYGAGLEKLGRLVTKSWEKELNIKQGRRIKSALERGLPALVELKETLLATAKKRGFLYDLDGQMFRLRSDHSCLNELNQRAGAILMKRAEVYLDTELRRRGLDFLWLLHVHDEWQLAVRPADVPTVLQVARDAFSHTTEYYKMLCPITGEGKAGGDWSETH